MVFLYNIFIALYSTGIRVSSLWNKKAYKWLKGRKDVFQQLSLNLHPGDKIIWVHASSTGELEQGKPLIEKLKKSYTTHKILLTVFSPSAYVPAKSYPFADIVCYLPLDTRKNAKHFINLVKPEAAFFIKYEFWYHFLSLTAFYHIPLFLVSAVFRKDQLFFKPYGGFYFRMLFFFRQIFVQDKTSASLLSEKGITHFSISGDTRYDRVKEIASNFNEIPFVREFINKSSALIAGSTWKEDEECISLIAKNRDAKIVIAPHEINEKRLDEIEHLFTNAIRYSQLNTGSLKSSNVLIIDNVGMLSRLYNYATICFVGGGFTKDGIHNILEAAVYGKPVLFGPNYSKYREAGELIKSGGGFSFNNSEELKNLFTNLSDNQQAYATACERSYQYILENTGATEKILSYIQANRLLTS